MDLKIYGFSSSELEGPFGTASMMSPFGIKNTQEDVGETQNFSQELKSSPKLLLASMIHRKM